MVAKHCSPSNLLSFYLTIQILLLDRFHEYRRYFRLNTEHYLCMCVFYIIYNRIIVSDQEYCYMYQTKGFDTYVGSPCSGYIKYR